MWSNTRFFCFLQLKNLGINTCWYFGCRQAVYRVGDLKSYIEWAKECFGMKLLRYREVPEDKYANAFLGFGPEETHFAMELTENFGVDSYDIGEGFGHFGIALAPPQKVYDTCEIIKQKGGSFLHLKCV